MQTETHRFKVGDQIFFEEETLTISQLTSINGWPAYFVKETGDRIADMDCSKPPKPVK